MQESARGVLLTPSGLVLLQKIASRRNELWITPGGRIRSGEDAAAAAVREVAEETGRRDLVPTAELWIRHGRYFAEGEWLSERERFFLMPTARFEPDPGGMEPEERRRHVNFRWWSVREISRSRETFVPRKIAELLRDLQQWGPPPSPVDSGE